MALLSFLRDTLDTADDILSLGQNNSAKETSDIDEDTGDSIWSDVRSRYSISCHKCGELAYPVRYTDKHYECTCGNKFTGVMHPYGDYTPDTWEDIDYNDL